MFINGGLAVQGAIIQRIIPHPAWQALIKVCPKHEKRVTKRVLS